MLKMIFKKVYKLYVNFMNSNFKDILFFEDNGVYVIFSRKSNMQLFFMFCLK